MQRYSGALTREQFMLREMRIVAGLRQAGLSDEEILEKVRAENLFQYPTEKEIRRKGRQCLKRVGRASCGRWRRGRRTRRRWRR